MLRRCILKEDIGMIKLNPDCDGEFFTLKKGTEFLILAEQSILSTLTLKDKKGKKYTMGRDKVVMVNSKIKKL